MYKVNINTLFDYCMEECCILSPSANWFTQGLFLLLCSISPEYELEAISLTVDPNSTSTISEKITLGLA